MILLEAALLTLLLVTLVSAGCTDCRNSQIPNKLILFSGGLALVLDFAYYGLWAGDFLRPFLVNLAMIVVLAFFFYIYHLWAAGDSKLFFAVGMCIPGRLYTFWDIGNVPSFVILIFVFSVAFLYVILESIMLGIKNRDLFRFSMGEVGYMSAIISYLSMVAASILVNWGLWKMFSRQFEYNLALSFAVSFLVVLTLIQIRNHLSRRGLMVAGGIGWTVILLLILTKQYRFQIGIDLRSWAIVLVVMAFRLIAEKYNYQLIPTAEIRGGQILSAATIMGFRASKVHGLPTGMTEDLRSRITAEEAESVKRWEHSKLGKPYVLIVRKIPFAVFIGIGTVAFIALGVVMK